MFIVFSGAPGVGKTTISRPLAQRLAAVYLRIDTIELPVMAAYGADIADTGYRVAYGVARDNLLLGRDVVADCVNPLNITRDAWRDVGLSAGVPVTEIEVLCSDPAEHRRRVETRSPDIPGLALPTWDQVYSWRVEPWLRARTVIDTAGRPVEDCLAELLVVLHG